MIRRDPLKEITEEIQYLPAVEEPLSADVYIIRGKEYTYVVDVGANDEAYETVRSVKGPKKVIITHFHGDHTGNLSRLNIPDEDLYVGAWMRKKYKLGTPVASVMEIHDGVELKVIPMASSHAKGCLAILVNGKCLLMGDSFYGHNDKGYNVSSLYDQIKQLKELDFEFAVMSHDERQHKKRKMLLLLEMYYAKRKPGEDYIMV